MNNNRVLIVDDTEINRVMLSDILEKDYYIVEAADGKEAIRILSQHHADISIVLLDILMPHMNGFEVMQIMNDQGWISEIPVIIISSESEGSYIDRAYELGATDYIRRPFDENIIRHRLNNAIMMYSNQKRLEDIVVEQIAEKEHNNLIMIEVLSNIVEFRNGESGLHVRHIRVLVDIFIQKIQQLTDRYPISEERAALIANASALHDIGKISIPEEILNKRGKLTKEEFELMKTHSEAGAHIMENILKTQSGELIEISRDICRWHHERYDGSGYPDGLVGDEIPIEAQIVSLADVYDALTSVRVYKPAYDHDTAIAMILNNECGVFNPVLITCLKELAPDLPRLIEEQTAEMISPSYIRKLSERKMSQRGIFWYGNHENLKIN